MQTVKFNAGETILSEGEIGSTAYLITAGTVKVTFGKGTKAKSIATLKKGDVFGEMSLLEPGPRSASVKAESDTECIVTSYDDFISSIENNPEHAVVFMKRLVRRLRHTNELMIHIDPRRRSIRNVLKDWQRSVESSDAHWSDEDRSRYQLMWHGGRR